MLTPTIAFIARGGAVGGPGPLLPFLVLLLIGGLAFWLIRRRNGSPGGSPGGSPSGSPGGTSALSVLQDRFARGEIDQAEFEHRKAVLTGADTVPPSGSSAATDPEQ